MRKKVFAILLLCLCLLLIPYHLVSAQDDDYTIHVRKDIGYNMGRNIQGRFTISLRGDEAQVQSVTFFINDSVLHQVDSAPFRHQFSTDAFDPGEYRLYAEVLLRDGTKLTTTPATFEFLSRQDSGNQITTILLGLGGVVLLTMLVVGLIQIFVGKGIGKQPLKPLQPGESRDYGMFGGAICARCGRTFSRHIWGINLVVGKLDRCDHCGKWVMARRASPEALRLAEQAEMEATQADEDSLLVASDDRNIYEDTKYFDSP